MKLIKLILTKDGSKTLFLPELNETYHSKFGAITESKHVFIKSGYQFLKQFEIKILEIGFGTGLNAVLTYLEHLKDGRKIYYESLEKYPLSNEIIKQLNYFSDKKTEDIFKKIHQADWQKPYKINNKFTLFKNKFDLTDYQSDMRFDLIYFDAFAPNKQPEMWTENIFQKMFNLLNSGGILVTYSAKGSVRRTMQSAGFIVERIPGPPGKREMLRAIKP